MHLTVDDIIPSTSWVLPASFLPSFTMASSIAESTSASGIDESQFRVDNGQGDVDSAGATKHDISTTSSNGHERQEQQDEVIGLQFTNGQIFYFFRSTLTKMGYFFKRFANSDDSSLDDTLAADEARDAMNRRVYFLERDALLFENHVMPFILTGTPGKLPTFSKDRDLWRRLRQEAKFYQLPKLDEILYVTSICSPNTSLGRGVFYYLGTDHGSSSHWNPHALGVLSVCRDAHYITPQEQVELLGAAVTNNKVFVQYRPTVTSMKTFNPMWTAVIGLSTLPQATPRGECCQFLPWRRHPKSPSLKIPTLIILRSISLRLIAYSLHKNAHGMSQWKLEGSNNGKDWTEIHTAEPASGYTTWTQKQMQAFKQELDMIRTDVMEIPQKSDPLEKVQVLLDEEEYSKRKIYEIDSPSKEFYKYFQIVAIHEDTTNTSTEAEQEDDENDDSDSKAMTRRALHGVGLELFGEIHEE